MRSENKKSQELEERKKKKEDQTNLITRSNKTQIIPKDIVDLIISSDSD